MMPRQNTNGFRTGSTKRIVWSGRHVLHSAGRSFTAGKKLAEVEFRWVGNWIVGRLQEVSDLFVGPSGNQTTPTEWNRRLSGTGMKRVILRNDPQTGRKPVIRRVQTGFGNKNLLARDSSSQSGGKSGDAVEGFGLKQPARWTSAGVKRRAPTSA